MTVSALNFKAFDRGAMRGFFDLRYHGMTVKGCRLMTGSNNLWMALPSKTVEQDGETKYLDIVELTKSEAEHVRRMVIADLQAQGHIDRPAAPTPRPKANAKRPRGKHITPEGEDVSEYYTPPGTDDEIQF